MNRASLIISVYNNTRSLEFIFYALSIQSFQEVMDSHKGFEVLVADDGSGDEMKNFISEWKEKNKFEINHIWQEDKGFRKNKILNECIRQSKTDYLIFIDGDCIPHSDFVKAHFENREKNTVLCGRRVNLTKSISNKINKENILNLKYQKIKLAEVVHSALSRDKKNFNFNIEEGIVIKNKNIRKLLLKSDVGMLGSNFSLHKKLIESINGFDENFIGPGYGEDTDLERRLRLYEAKIKSIRNLAIQYHLYHNKTIEASNNREYYNKIKDNKEYFCKNGLMKSN